MTRLILHTHNELIDCLIVFINVCLHSVYLINFYNQLDN